MSDNDSENEKDKMTPKIDVTKLGLASSSLGTAADRVRHDLTNLYSGPLGNMADLSGRIEPTRDALREIVKASTLNELADPLRNLRDDMHAGKFTEAIDAAQFASKNLGMSLQERMGLDLHERLASITETAAHGSALARAAEGISRQQETLDRISKERDASPPIWHDISPTVSPLVETNHRLERIEEHFEQSAQVATDIQLSAAEFIQDFKIAAADTSRSSKTAIWVAIAAVVITMAQPFLPRFFPDPEAAALRESVDALTTELTGLRLDTSVKKLTDSPVTTFARTVGPR